MDLKKMGIPDFSKIKIDHLEDYYHADLNYGDRKIGVDINFEVPSTVQSELNRILEFINRIPLLDRTNEEHIKADLNNSPSMTLDYLSFYVEELEDYLGTIIEVDTDLQVNIERLKEKLNVIRVGIYPQASYLATFDYSIDIEGEPCNQLLVLNINEDGSLHNITWES